MDGHVQGEALKSKWRDDRGLSPEERAEAARQRLLDAAARLGTPGGKIQDRAKRDPLASMGLALLAGFIIGYSPEFRAMFMESSAGLVQALLRKL